MLPIDLSGKRALVAGIADDKGYGWAIVRSLAQAGASVCVGTWPPTMKIFTKSLERGKLDMSLPGGGELELERIYPLDAVFDTPDDVPEEVSEDKRYVDLEGYTIQGVANALYRDFGEDCLDIVVHSLANGPEVQNALIDTSRAGYLAALSASAYSLVSMVQRFGPLMHPGGAVVSLSYLAAVRVNTISAGPLASRAAKAIGTIQRMVEYYEENAALPEANTAEEVGMAATFLCSPLASGITGETLHVDKGYHAMGMQAEATLSEN